MDLLVAKGLSLILILLDSLLFGWPPYFLVRGDHEASGKVRTREAIISHLNCFAGGVFLGACLLHLWAEGNRDMRKYFKMIDSTVNFPLFEVAVSVGFFFIAFVEQVAHTFLYSPSQEQVPHTHKHNFALDVLGGLQTAEVDKNGCGTADQGSDMKGQKSEEKSREVNGEINGESKREVEREVYIGGILPSDDTVNGLFHSHSKFKLTNINGVENAAFDVANDDPNVNKGTKPGPPREVTIEATRGSRPSSLKAFLLLGALSFHTVFDGLAIGLQGDEAGVWKLFVAIVIHKSLVAVCLGLQLFLAYKASPNRAFICLFFFALIAPMGVGIGMVLTSGNIDVMAEKLASWILQGVSTGTFLYVTFFEILKDELGENGGVVKILIVVLGFGFMAAAKALDYA